VPAFSLDIAEPGQSEVKLCHFSPSVAPAAGAWSAKANFTRHTPRPNPRKTPDFADKPG
jgi:hypothetical protein